jgi:hypothetical protein
VALHRLQEGLQAAREINKQIKNELQKRRKTVYMTAVEEKEWIQQRQTEFHGQEFDFEDLFSIPVRRNESINVNKQVFEQTSPSGPNN